MSIKEPQFWYKNSLSFSAYLLIPMGILYRILSWIHTLTIRSRRVDCPVICIGNLVAGGAGKTPTALKIAELLKKKGRKVHFLTRGYGGSLTGVVRVNPCLHTYKEVGDEALLLSACAPTWASANRFKGAQAARQAGAEIIIMDDGFQNPTLQKDLNIIAVDGQRGFGNGLTLPAGPLREPLKKGLARAQAILIIGEDDKEASPPPQQESRSRNGRKALFPFSVQEKFPRILQLKGALIPAANSIDSLKKQKYLAFCGIGRPDKFFSMLEREGVSIIKKVAFADHHPYSEKDSLNLIHTAKVLKGGLVTTRKDWVRLPLAFRDAVQVVDITLEFEDENKIFSLLEKSEKI